MTCVLLAKQNSDLYWVDCVQVYFETFKKKFGRNGLEYKNREEVNWPKFQIKLPHMPILDM